MPSENMSDSRVEEKCLIQHLVGFLILYLLCLQQVTIKKKKKRKYNTVIMLLCTLKIQFKIQFSDTTVILSLPDS